MLAGLATVRAHIAGEVHAFAAGAGQDVDGGGVFRTIEQPRFGLKYFKWAFVDGPVFASTEIDGTNSTTVVLAFAGLIELPKLVIDLKAVSLQALF